MIAMSRPSRPFAGLLALALLVAAGTVAEAQTASPNRAAARAAFMACRSDLGTYCANVEPGGGRILACMKTHEADLSQDCRDALAKAAANR